MAFAASSKAVVQAVKSPIARIRRSIPNVNGLGQVPNVARRQSARTSPNGNPPKGVGTLKGSGLR